MSWHIISLADIAPQPWRNGGGITRELIAFPVHEQWHWRMSVAEVTQDGPFSRYEGVQRWFAVLSGAGVRLRVNQGLHEAHARSAPISFGGADDTHCSLVQGPTRDFNLMVRQGNGRMERLQGDRSLAVSSASAVALWSGDHAARATFEGRTVDLMPHTLAWRHLDLGGRVHLSATDGLWMEIAP